MSSQDQEQTRTRASDSDPQPWTTEEGNPDPDSSDVSVQTQGEGNEGSATSDAQDQVGFGVAVNDQTESPIVQQDPGVDAALSEMHLGVQGGPNDDANWDLSPQPNTNPQLTADDIPSPVPLPDASVDAQVPVESSSEDMTGIELIRGVRGTEGGVGFDNAAVQDAKDSQVLSGDQAGIPNESNDDAASQEDSSSSSSEPDTDDAAPHEPKTIETSSTQPEVVPTVSSTGMPRLFPRSLDDPQSNVGSSGPPPAELQPESTVANAVKTSPQDGPAFSMTLTALTPSSGMPWRRRIAVLAFSAVVNLGFPIINGAMAGLGEIFARSIVAPFVIDSFHSRWPGLKPAKTEDPARGKPAQIRDK